MPYKCESIKLKGLQDKRRKLTDEQKLNIIELYESGFWSLQQLADKYKVSKKTILLTVNKESAEKAKQYCKDNWKKYQQDTTSHTKAVRKHRRYKQRLYLQGKLKEEKDA